MSRRGLVNDRRIGPWAFSGRCIYDPSGGAFYGKTKPERCYATEEQARQDGYRRSKR